MKTLKTAATALLVALVLVTCADYAAFARTGQSLLLGRANFADKMTTLKRTTNGPALKLTTKNSAAAPFVTNATGKVARLNADRVDGLNAADLKTKAYVFTTDIPVANPMASVSLTIPVPNGRYLVSYSAFMVGAAGDHVRCALVTRPLSGDYTYAAESNFTAGAFAPGLTGTAYMAKTADNTLRLACSSDTAWYTLPDQPIQIVATAVDTLAANQSIAP